MPDDLALDLYAQRRDPEAFGHLVRRYQRLVYRACFRRLGNEADAQDATQVTFLRLAQHAAKIRTRLATWLYVCATKTAIDIARQREAYQRRNLARATAPDACVQASELQDLLAEVDQAILRLPAAEQELIVRHYLQGESQVDLAREAGITPAGMKWRLDRALEHLRQELRLVGEMPAPAAVAGLFAAEAVAAVPARLAEALNKIGLSGTPAVAATSAGTTLLTMKGWIIAMGSIAVLLVAGTVVLVSQPTTAPQASSSTQMAGEVVATHGTTRPAKSFRTVRAVIQEIDRPNAQQGAGVGAQGSQVTLSLRADGACRVEMVSKGRAMVQAVVRPIDGGIITEEDQGGQVQRGIYLIHSSVRDAAAISHPEIYWMAEMFEGLRSAVGNRPEVAVLNEKSTDGTRAYSVRDLTRRMFAYAIERDLAYTAATDRGRVDELRKAYEQSSTGTVWVSDTTGLPVRAELQVKPGVWLEIREILWDQTLLPETFEMPGMAGKVVHEATQVYIGNPQRLPGRVLPEARAGLPLKPGVRVSVKDAETQEQYLSESDVLCVAGFRKEAATEQDREPAMQVLLVLSPEAGQALCGYTEDGQRPVNVECGDVQGKALVHHFTDDRRKLYDVVLAVPLGPLTPDQFVQRYLKQP